MKEVTTLANGNTLPMFTTFVAIDTDIYTPDWRLGEVRQYYCKVASPGDHGMSPVRRALFCAAWMCMYIGDNGKATLSALLPKRTEVTTIKMNDATVQTAGIEVIIKHKVYDPGASVSAQAQEERSAFANFPPAAVSKFCKEPTPEKPGAGDLMSRRPEAPYSLGN
ncbi:MAG: hypothetical protein M1438_11240 [Deltaproteobacteria bacterium]|nr:hypothetical protein [Deltaproteobacteria bacterium]